MDSRGNGSFAAPKPNKKHNRPRPKDYEAPEQEFIVVEDKAAANYLIIRVSEDGNDIICRAKMNYWALDIAAAMNSMFGPEEEE